MAGLQCPICGKQFDSKESNAMPFCSQRCRLIDLGRWLREERGLPVAPNDEEEQD
jgi:endogenous inhibitor of DNA gyrase (YacG/DUF329 family)